MKWVYHSVEIECIQGDITRQNDVEVVVNAANAWLRPGGGVAGAIHRAAGPALEEECRPLAPLQPGQAVITSGHRLPNPWVIHCLGPVFGIDQPEDKLLADCYKNALRLADARQLSSIAFPAISTGAFGYPLPEAAQVTAQALEESIPRLRYIRKIRLVLFSSEGLAIFSEEFGSTAFVPR